MPKLHNKNSHSKRQSNKHLRIDAKIENLKYNPSLCQQLKIFTIDEFLSGEAFNNASFLLSYNKNLFAISYWVSPKRTRSYPYARVYDTMNNRTRVTIIPFLKDEGKQGDRDFIQWDTVSLMSLLGVYVILGYYKKAEKSTNYKHKITSQQFDYDYLKKRIDELSEYKLDALHWNLNELNKNLLNVAELSKSHYKKISKQTGVEMHNDKGILERIEIIKESINKFQSNSRLLALSAQKREFKTVQPKESIIENKATITIKNYLGGYYFFTVDEVYISEKTVFLIEKKHSENSILPSIADIKDGLIKMMLYTNFSEVLISEKSFYHHSALGLTSKNIRGYCHNFSSEKEISSFFTTNRFTENNQQTLLDIFNEGRNNNLLVFLMNSKTPKLQNKIINEFLERRIIS